MRIAKVLAVSLGLIIAAVGLLGVAAPSVLLEFGRLLQSTNALYIVAGVRVMFGGVLLWVAPTSRTPRIFRVLGVFIIIAGVITPFFGVERSRAMFEWWSTQGVGGVKDARHFGGGREWVESEHAELMRGTGSRRAIRAIV